MISRFLNNRIIYSLLLMVVVICGCDRGDGKIRVGVSQPSDDEWRRQMNDEIHRETLLHDNIEVEIRSADDDSRKQIADLEYFTDNGFDIIIIAPNEAESLTPAVRKVWERGIPVIVFDRNINDTTYTSRIDMNNTGIGRAAGNYALSLHKNIGGKIIEITGLPGSTPAEERHRGFISALSVLPDTEFAGSYNGDWRAEPARRLVDSLIAVNPAIKIIYAHNDIMAIAASEASKAKGREDIMVIGTDGAPSPGLKAVSDSVIDATVTYPTVGEEVISLAREIADGKKIEKEVVSDGQMLIDGSNADMHLRMNELLQRKTAKIEEVNSRYDLLSASHKTQRLLLYFVIAAALLLWAVVVGLLYFLRQKARYEKELSAKNSDLTRKNEEIEGLYSSLEEATKSRLAFFTNISHDLRTPLALIAEPVEKISRLKYLQPNDRSLMEMVRKNVKILRRMIEQILDFRKYENGDMKIYISEVDVAARIKEWVGNFKEYALARRITLTLDLHLDRKVSNRNLDHDGNERDGMVMETDVEKLERICFNLLSNALKFTPEGGSVKVDCSLGEKGMILCVSDTGEGIDEKSLDKIFDRFYQADSPRPRGSGIGLSLTKAFVEMLHGTITVQSRRGEGSVFIVTIPKWKIQSEVNVVKEGSLDENGFSPALTDVGVIAPVGKNVDEVIENREGDGEQEKPLLLVIDDNEDLRGMVRIMMTDSYTVIEAADGKEGLRMAVKYLPDLIVCDIMMPDMDGLEVTRRLKEEKITSHIPVLILTACRLDEQRVRSYDSGADAFLSKPFTETMLKSRSAALIHNRRLIFDLFLEKGSENVVNLGSKNESVEGKDRLELDNEFYRDFIAIVRAEYQREDLTVVEIAEKLGIGATQLTRKIKALTKTTPVDIIRGIRLREARKKILTTDMTISEIAFSTGFSSPQYFARCFREAFQITPTELRASMR